MSKTVADFEEDYKRGLLPEQQGRVPQHLCIAYRDGWRSCPCTECRKKRRSAVLGDVK